MPVEDQIPQPPVVVFAFKNITLQGGNNYPGTCKFCTYGKRDFSFSKKSSSNLVRHLKSKHPHQYNCFVNRKKDKPQQILNQVSSSTTAKNIPECSPVAEKEPVTVQD